MYKKKYEHRNQEFKAFRSLVCLLVGCASVSLVLVLVSVTLAIQQHDLPTYITRTINMKMNNCIFEDLPICNRRIQRLQKSFVCILK